MPRYKGFVFLLLCMNISLADVTGVAFCELAHSESQQHTLNALMKYYEVDSCEAVFAAGKERKGIKFNGQTLENQGKPLTDITPICAMSHWQHLSIANVAIEDFSCLSTMPIKQMQLRNSTPVNLKPISDIKTLEYLYIITTGIINYEAIGNATSLEHLDIAGKLTDTKPLSTLYNLHTLILNINPIEDYSGLSQLTQLRRLELRSTGMKDADLEHLRLLTHLGNLNLANNHLTDISALAGLTDLWQLNISQNQVVDVSPLAGMEQLTRLKANDNQIEDITPLVNLPLLHTIDVNNNRLNDTSGFAQLPKLSWFVAIENPLYECAPISASDLNKGAICTEADIERLSNPSLWQRAKNLFQ